MASESDLQILEIGFSDFDLNLIPEPARVPGTTQFKSAVEDFYQNQLGKIATNYTINVEADKIRVTWRTSTLRPNALDEGISALQKGDYASGVQILEILASSRDQDPALHYNLGMAYSDLGKLDEAVKHLQRALEIDKRMVNAKVALGVAYARLKEVDKATRILREAVLDDPDNGYALRNLAAVLMQVGSENADALRYLRRAVELLPEDQQAWFGLAQAEMNTGDLKAADRAAVKVIEIQPFTQIASMAKQLRSDIAQKNFRGTPSGAVRPDAVMYCVAALQKFASMSTEQVRNVGFEIATVGMSGINVNDPKSTYRLRTLPGVFTGLQLVCYEYVAFKQFAPDLDIGFDLAKEYEEAVRMKKTGV